MMNEINEYLWSQKITGTKFNGLFRGFNNYSDDDYKFDQGGRLYNQGEGFQSLSKAKRKHIRINDQETIEIDIKASHLSILHGLFGLALPEGDPYDFEDIPRDIVKQWMTISLSLAAALKQWPHQTRNELTSQFHDMSKWTAPVVSKAALIKYPFLSMMNNCDHGWAKLQFMESEILIRTMLELMNGHDVPSLPVHDSLIVPRDRSGLVEGIMKKHFKQSLGINVQLEVSS